MGKNIFHYLFGRSRNNALKSLEEEFRAHLKTLEEHLETKDEIINMLKLDLMSAKGTLNSRGLLEALLINVKVEKKLTGNFNASRTCESIELNTQHHYEKVLVDAALEVFKVYEDRDLNQNSEGVPSILYLHIYRKLSSKIHERPYHGSKIAIPPEFEEDWRKLFGLL